jgi:hypothetical protein
MFMNTGFVKRTFSILSLGAFSVALSGLSAQAQIPSNAAKAPVPGTAPTSSSTLQQRRTTAPTVAQVVSPGRATRSGPSYIGVGGNIGFGGDTTLSEGAFSIISKIGLTNNLSARPSVLINDGAVFLIPLTIDFPIGSVDTPGRINVAPYLGGGAAVSTRGRAGGLLTGGVDVPLSSQFTGNAAVNVGFMDGAEVGFRVGVGYNF